MSNESDHRKYAAFTLELASRTSSNFDKLRLLAMAEAWLDLADRARRVSWHYTAKEHPLVTAKLGRADRQHAK